MAAAPAPAAPAPLAAPPAPAPRLGGPSLQVGDGRTVDLAENRRLVSVLFADLSGSTVLGDGRVALILDVVSLVRSATARKAETVAA